MSEQLARRSTAMVLALVAGLALGHTPLAVAQESSSSRAEAGVYLAGRAAMMAANFRVAQANLAQAVEQDPTNTVLLESLLLAEMALGNMDAAALAADQLIALGGGNIAANMALMLRDAKAGNYDALINLPEARSVSSLLDRLMAAWAEYGAGRMSAAVELFDAMAQTEGFEALGLYHKALALAAVGDFQTADDILAGRSGTQLAVGRAGLVAHLQILSQLEKNAEAIAYIDRIFGADPEPAMAGLRERLEAGETLPFDAVTSAQDGMAEVFLSLAEALQTEGEQTFTLLHTRAASYLAPERGEPLLLSAGILAELGQLSDAVDLYSQIPAESSLYISARIGLAEVLYRQEKSDESLAILQELTVAEPRLVLAHVAYGDALRQEERFAEAAAAYSTAIGLIPELRPNHWGLMYSRAIAYERAGEWEKAEPDFRKALELNPEQPQVLNYLGYSFVDRGENLEEALSLIERAVAAQPDAGYIIDSLAWAYFRLGRYADAMEPMERASLLEPADPVVTDHLGDVLWANGRKREAAFQWRRALSFEPTEKDAARIRSKLELGLDAVLEQEGAPPLDAVGNGN